MSISNHHRPARGQRRLPNLRRWPRNPNSVYRWNTGLKKEEEEGPRQKGVSNMLSHDEIAEQPESQVVTLSKEAVSEAFRIEEVLTRAHEIRRARGGLFGYDLEDWLQAERELTERNRSDQFWVEETAHVESRSWDQERNSEQCLGLNN